MLVTVEASFCTLVRAPLIESLDKLVAAFCAYDMVDILDSVANIIAITIVRPMTLVCIISSTNSSKNIIGIRSNLNFR